MAKKTNNKELTDKLVSVLSKPVAHKQTCKTCGNEFFTNTENTELENCLPCQVKLDMKLDDGTIINFNMLNLWKAKRFDNEKGIDPLLCAVAEGIVLLPDDVENRNHLTVITSISRKITNKEIEGYLKKAIKNANKKYDAVLILRFNATDDFSIFRIRMSKRLVDKLSKKTPLFIKKYMISLVVKNVLKKAKKK